MTEPAEIIAKALRDAKVPPDAPTRLATVTGFTPTTVTVRFDGETAASARAYPRAYGPAYVDDRVIMLRTGSTWVALTRLSPTSGNVAVHDTGPNNLTYQNSWFSYDAAAYGPLQIRVINGIAYMSGLVQQNSSSLTGSTITTLPTGSKPFYNRIFQIPSGGGPVALYVMWTGQVYCPGNTFWGTWLSMSAQWPADQ